MKTTQQGYTPNGAEVLVIEGIMFGVAVIALIMHLS